MIAAIEQAVLDRLEAMGAAIGVTWRFLDTIPHDFEAYLQRKRSEIKGPAAWVAFMGWDKAERVDDQLIVDGSFALLVANQTQRPDEAANRHGVGTATEPGVYRLALGASAVLGGQMLGLDLVTPIEVGAAELLPRTKVMIDMGLSIALVDLSCRFPIQLSVGDSPPELEALHVNWDMPLRGLPFVIDRDPVAAGVQLPDDANADATDHIILQEPVP